MLLLVPIENVSVPPLALRPLSCMQNNRMELIVGKGLTAGYNLCNIRSRRQGVILVGDNLLD